MTAPVGLLGQNVGAKNSVLTISKPMHTVRLDEDDTLSNLKEKASSHSHAETHLLVDTQGYSLTLCCGRHFRRQLLGMTSFAAVVKNI